MSIGSIKATSRFSTTATRRTEEKNDRKPDAAVKHPPKSKDGGSDILLSQSLPSQSDQKRWKMSKRMAHVMDEILARASVASHRINAYTGTDYSGIEALRKEIAKQELGVRESHQQVDNARAHHRDAHAKQAGSQKEIVGLLERKSSWSPGDLERYMSLVRSEHSDDQAVQRAKEELALAERELETSRSLLERLERKQYHEEQIWSDTIRRNSTWVTFGLMGVNIILLLAQIAVFEPHRRRKIVREMQKALDEKTVQPLYVGRTQAAIIDADSTLAANVPPHTLAAPDGSDDSRHGSIELSAEAAQSASTAIAADGNERVAYPESGLSAEDPAFIALKNASPRYPEWLPDWLQSNIEQLRDLVSERQVHMRMVDVTTTAVGGIAAGAAVTSVLIILTQAR